MGYPALRAGLLQVAALTVAATLTLWTVEVIARSGGVAGVSQSATGCSCHNSTPNANGAVTVNITGPQSVSPGSTITYTVTATGLPAGTTGGVDLKATGGTLIAGTGTAILSGELVHSNNARRSWTFGWQAPAVDGPYNFYAVGMASSGSSSSGDSWNWYGGAVNTPFIITVSSLVGVGDAVGGELSLAPVAPNPASGPARIAFVLPTAGAVSLEVFDLNGRRVALILDGEQPAGPHGAVWQGTNDRGERVASGRYIIRLSAGGRSLARSVTLLH